MEEKKEFRKVPVLVKPGASTYTGRDDLERIRENLIKKRYPIADLEKEGYSFYNKEPWGGCAHMEIFSEVVDTVEEEDDRTEEKFQVSHVKIKILFIPDKGEVHYSCRPSKENDDRAYADSFDVDVVEDIVKYDEVLFFPFMYYLIHEDKCPFEINGRRRYWAFEDLKKAGLVIDSIEIDEETATPAFLEWFETVGLNLVNGSDARNRLANILDGAVYVVYGDFDPATRKNLRKEKMNEPDIPELDEEDNVDED